MSESNPSMILDGAGHSPTALELMHDYIISVTPGAVSNVNVFMAYSPDAVGLVRFVEESPGGTMRTMGKNVALEFPLVTVTVRGNPFDYQTPKDEAVRLRYWIAAIRNYTSRGMTILDASPEGTIQPIGRDIKNREGFEILFTLMMEPGYV